MLYIYIYEPFEICVYAKGLLRAIFCDKKSNKKADRFCLKFLQSLIPGCRCPYIPHFKINAPIFSCTLFSENHLNPLVKINKMVNKDTVDYYPSSSKLISRIHPLIFLWTPKGSISPKSFLNFFLNLYIPPCLQKRFKFIVLIFLAKGKKVESVLFYFTHFPKQNFPTGFYY